MPDIEELDRLKALERAVFLGADLFMVVTDHQGLVLDMNPAAECLLGWARAECVGRITPLDWHDPAEMTERAGQLSHELGQPVAGFQVFVALPLRGRVEDREWTLIRRDGSRFSIQLRVNPLFDAAGASLGFVGIGRDLTEQRRADRALAKAAEESRARQQAERESRAKTRFLASASHDLRQPLQAMRLYHGLLESRLTTPEQRDLAARLSDAMGSAEDLLRALMDVSVLDEGRIVPVRSAVDLQAGLARLVAEMEAPAAAAGLRLRHVPSRLVVDSDPVLLDRILRNLVSNAVKYTRTGRILVGCRRRGAEVEILVLDTGPGISADELGAIFEDFYRVRAEVEAEDGPQGLGLGLSIVARTAALLGHVVLVRSEPGRGSCFGLRVPLAVS